MTFCKIFLLTFLSALFLNSCTYRPYRDYQKVNEAGGQHLRPILSLIEQPSYLFKSSLDYKEHSFSGLLLIKEMQKDIYRATFTTELGMKLFDLEIDQQQAVVHYCYEPINRKSFLDIITADIQLLLMQNISRDEVETFSDPGEKNILYKIGVGKEVYYYLVDNATGNLLSMEKTRGKKSKIRMELSGHQSNFPYRIDVTHGDLDLDLTLKFIKR